MPAVIAGVAGVGQRATGEAGDHVKHTLPLLESGLHAPETAAGEQRFSCSAQAGANTPAHSATTRVIPRISPSPALPRPGTRTSIVRCCNPCARRPPLEPSSDPHLPRARLLTGESRMLKSGLQAGQGGFWPDAAGSMAGGPRQAPAPTGHHLQEQSCRQCDSPAREGWTNWQSPISHLLRHAPAKSRSRSGRVHSTSTTMRWCPVCCRWKTGAFRYPMAPAWSPPSARASAISPSATGCSAAFSPTGRDGPPAFARLLGVPGDHSDGFAARTVNPCRSGLHRDAGQPRFRGGRRLTCAGLTAWRALMVETHLRPGDWVLVQSSGGVSVFALQLARIMGCRVIATSSSDAKLERLRALGAGTHHQLPGSARVGETGAGPDRRPRRGSRGGSGRPRHRGAVGARRGLRRLHQHDRRAHRLCR